MATYSSSKPDPKSQQLRQAWLESGELEIDKTEFDLPSEEPVYVDLIKNPNYLQEASKLAREMYTPKIQVDRSHDMDRIVKASEIIEGSNHDFVQTIESDTVSENKSEFRLGNTVEIVFNQPQSVEVHQEFKNDTPVVEKTSEKPGDKAPSALSEILADTKIDFRLLGKRTFGFASGLFGGLKDVFGMVFYKEEKKKSQEDIAKEKKKAENKKAFYQATKDAMAEATGFVRQKLMALQSRLGVAGMGSEAMNQYMGQNRNVNNADVSEYAIHETAKAVTEAQKIQKKRIEAMKEQSVQKPTINMQGMAEGGTAGGKANISSVASAG